MKRAGTSTEPEEIAGGGASSKRTRLLLPPGLSMQNPTIRCALERLMTTNPGAQVVRVVKVSRSSTAADEPGRGMRRTSHPSLVAESHQSPPDLPASPKRMVVSARPTPAVTPKPKIGVHPKQRIGIPPKSVTATPTAPPKPQPKPAIRVRPVVKDDVQRCTEAIAARILEDLEMKNKRLSAVNAQLLEKNKLVKVGMDALSEKVSRFFSDDDDPMGPGTRNIKTAEQIMSRCTRYFSPIVSNFFNSQFRNCKRLDQSRRWLDNDFLLAFTIYAQSPQCYVYLSKLVALPPTESLNRWLDKAEVKPEAQIDYADYENTVLGCLLMKQGEISCQNLAPGAEEGQDRQPEAYEAEDVAGKDEEAGERPEEELLEIAAGAAEDVDMAETTEKTPGASLLKEAMLASDIVGLAVEDNGGDLGAEGEGLNEGEGTSAAAETEHRAGDGEEEPTDVFTLMMSEPAEEEVVVVVQAGDEITFEQSVEEVEVHESMADTSGSTEEAAVGDFDTFDALAAAVADITGSG